MRVAVDLRWMRPGHAGGIETLSRAFLNELLALDGFNEYTVIVPAEVRYDFDVRGRPNFAFVNVDGPSYYWSRLVGAGSPLNGPPRPVLRRGCEVALSVPGYIHPDLRHLANVVIVADIQHEFYPEYFSAQDLASRRRLYGDAVRRAARICAISEFTRGTLIARLGVPPDRVTAIPLAADRIFHAGSPWRGATDAVLARYALRQGDYVLLPANAWPHKNHRGAFAALRLLRDVYHLDPLLVCTGNMMNALPELRRAARELGVLDRVRFLGYCRVEEMPALYEGAAALLLPSLFEGFGMPLLEAMWCNCPVVCSNTTSLPEIAGDAALLVDPNAEEQVAEALSRVLGDDALRLDLVARGQARAALFSWRRFTLDLLQLICAAHRIRYTDGRAH